MGNNQLMIDLEKEIKKIKKHFNFSSDLIERRLALGKRQGALLYLDGMISVKTIDLGLVEPLLRKGDIISSSVRALDGIVETSEKLEYFSARNQALERVLVGACLILIDGVDDYAVCSAQGFSSRPI
ncbi:MAG: spore germination protein, partial [Clostridia bacterium]|nr:spore germination protein [Clostridia bacterium]